MDSGILDLEFEDETRPGFSSWPQGCLYNSNAAELTADVVNIKCLVKVGELLTCMMEGLLGMSVGPAAGPRGISLSRGTPDADGAIEAVLL